MKLNFCYDKEKDTWCLLNKGKSSNNSPAPTNVYSELIDKYGIDPDVQKVSLFIDEYLKEKGYDINDLILKCEKDFNNISSSFEQIAERVFNVQLNTEITVYLTINNRCPYSIEEKWFFVSISQNTVIKTLMHELWHFYTWEKFGTSEVSRLGVKKYNDIKEALTVLLNVECKDLLPEGSVDTGYSQHQELRQRILDLWSKEKDIQKLWTELAS